MISPLKLLKTTKNNHQVQTVFYRKILSSQFDIKFHFRLFHHLKVKDICVCPQIINSLPTGWKGLTLIRTNTFSSFLGNP